MLVRRVVAPFAAVLCALVVAGSLALGTLAVVAKTHEQTVACQQVNILRESITDVLNNSGKGLSKNAYFKARPDQLKLAEQQYREDLAKFKPVAC